MIRSTICNARHAVLLITVLCTTLYAAGVVWSKAPSREDTGTTIRVAAVSFVPTKFDLQGNAARLEAAFRRAAEGGAKIALAPEGALDGYVVNEIIAGKAEVARMREVAIPIDHEIIQHFQKLALELKMCLAFGLAELIDKDVFNCAVFIDHSGKICGKYHKMQLAEGYDPEWWYNRLGRQSRAFDTPYGRCGILICNDRWNPSLARIPVLDGAQFLLIPAFGSRSLGQDRAVLSRARENSVPILEANVGVTLVIDSNEIVAVDREEDGITFGEMTIPAATAARPVERDAVEQAFLAWREQEMPSRLERTFKRLAEKKKQTTKNSELSSWTQQRKKLIHAGYPAEVPYIRQNAHRMQSKPFDGTIFAIHELRPLFNYERRYSREALQKYFDDMQAIDWGRLTDNFLLMQVEQSSKIDWFDDAQWENVEHNLQLAIEALLTARGVGIIFDPEQYSHPLWLYEKAAHAGTKTYEEYFAQLRHRGSQWMRVAQSVKSDLKILHYYLMTAFDSYYDSRIPPGGDVSALLKQNGYGLYIAFLNGMLDAAGPDITFIDGNESSYYYAGRAAYDGAYVQMRQDRTYLIAQENREKFRRQVQAGSAIYMQGTLGMRNYSIQALGAFFKPAERLRLLEHRAYNALRTTDEYAWCYSDARGFSWWTDLVPVGSSEALQSAVRKIAAGEPLGFSEEPFVAAKREQQRIMQHGRDSIVPRSAQVTRVGDEGPPIIDGKLDDALWRRAKPLKKFRVPNIYIKETLEAPTTARLAWDDKHLYVAFMCDEPKIEQISRRTTTRDGGVWNDDCIEVFISATADTFPYRHFEVNAIDTHFDATWNQPKKMDASWNAKWQSRSVIGTDGWTAEIAIPWKEIGTPPRPGETRRGNLTRHRIPHEEETTTWTPMYKTFSDAQYLGYWVFENSKR